MSSKPFGIITFDGTVCKTYSSTKEAAKKLGVSESAIRRALYSTIKNIGDLRVYYNSQAAIEEIASLIKERQIELRQVQDDSGEDEGNKIKPIELARKYSRLSRRKRNETAETFAKELTDNNEYLTEEWERRTHYKIVKSAYEWGFGKQ